MLEIIQDLVFIKIFHIIGCNKVLKYFAKYTCEGYGHVVCKIWLSPAGKVLTSWLSFVITFPCGILGQVWCLIVSIPDLCPLSYCSPFLKMGETFALSHSDGRDPSSRDLKK